VGAAGMQGWRPEMEDSHIIEVIESKPDHIFLAVFDGHGGAGAAAYAAKNMISTLEATSEWQQYLRDGEENIELVGKAMQNAFLKIDSEMRKHQDKTDMTPRPDTSGCTSVTAIVTPKWIICANAGDSRCVLSSNGDAIAMSEDHKPYDDSERDRIIAAGGSVQYKRVDGDLAVSRALGDFQYKQRSDLSPQDQKVSCFPDIRTHERTAADEVLLLACDGLWDVMTNVEAMEQCRRLFKCGESDMRLFCEEMVDLALEKGDLYVYFEYFTPYNFLSTNLLAF